MKKESEKMGKKTFSSPAKHSKNLGQTAFRKPSKDEHEGKMSKGMKK